ncbi:MAG: hypothetical protein FJ216_04525 [Ignavibacteria bacterium]|nr:hypothetical protein [Ignavibacteria bacterium]
MDFKLVSLSCKKCGSGLVVSFNDFVTYCTSCGSGFEITDGEMHPVEINFAAPAIRKGSKENAELTYKPFWLVRTYINLYERKAAGLMNKLFNKNEGFAQDVIFYIPAFYCSLESLKNISQNFTMNNPFPSPQKYNTKLTGFAYGKEDAKKLVEFIFISFEAEKSDMLKELKYKIDFKSFEIIGVPFYKISDNAYKDAVMGIEIRV